MGPQYIRRSVKE